MFTSALKPLVVAAGIATGLLFAGSDAKAQAIVPVGHHYGHHHGHHYGHYGHNYHRPYYGGYRGYARPYYGGGFYRPGGMSFSVTPGYGFGLGYSSGGYYSPYGYGFRGPWGW
jgi:hypothetical protein